MSMTIERQFEDLQLSQYVIHPFLVRGPFSNDIFLSTDNNQTWPNSPCHHNSSNTSNNPINNNPNNNKVSNNNNHSSSTNNNSSSPAGSTLRGFPSSLKLEDSITSHLNKCRTASSHNLEILRCKGYART